MSPPPLPDLESLLAQAGWIRSLARNLVADRSRADDLVQRTFVAALEHPPEPSTPLRRWLGAVVRNFARQDRRGERRRVARETASARPEATASAQEAVEAVAIQRELFDAVLSLEEPYRATIVQRFYEGLPPREIARRHDVPVKTVKTRLSRGLEKLRAALDRRHGGDREAWLPALIPLAAWPALPASTLWTLLVNTKIKIAVAVVALAGAVAVVWTATSDVEKPSVSPALAAEPETQLETSASRANLADAPTATPRETIPEIPHSKVRELPPGHPILDAIARGRVIDVEGRAVGGVPLVVVPHENGTPLDAFRSAEASTGAPIATSRADGTFEMTSPANGGTLLARSRELTTVFAADIGWSQVRIHENLVVVVAPRGGLGGVVVDSEGTPIPKAQVEVRVERGILGNLTGIADQTFEIPWRASTDERGRFEIEAAPAMKGAMLVTTASGWLLDVEPAPERPALDLRIVLRREEKPSPRGEVVDSRGRPVPGALVSCNLSTSRTDDQGRFTIDLDRMFFQGPDPVPVDEIVALKEGFLPARFTKPSEGWPAFVTLRLEGDTLEIRGHVVDEDGSGVAGAEVWAVDEHGFGVVLEEVGGTGRYHSIEALLRGGLETTTSGKDGAFVLRGLLATDYRVACMRRKDLLFTESDPIPAGRDDLRLVLGGAGRCVRVAGRVVSRSGKAIEGVVLHPGLRLPRWPYLKDIPYPMFGSAATTDAEGKFAFERLSPEGLSFQLLSPNLLVTEWKPPAEAKLGELEIVVALRCHLQVDLGERADLGESFTVLDASGSKLEAIEYQGPIATVQDPVPIEKGRSPVVAVTEDAKTLVLSKAGQEVARFPLALAPGELKIVRP